MKKTAVVAAIIACLLPLASCGRREEPELPGVVHENIAGMVTEVLDSPLCVVAVEDEESGQLKKVRLPGSPDIAAGDRLEAECVFREGTPPPYMASSFTIVMPEEETVTVRGRVRSWYVAGDTVLELVLGEEEFTLFPAAVREYSECCRGGEGASYWSRDGETYYDFGTEDCWVIDLRCPSPDMPAGFAPRDEVIAVISYIPNRGDFTLLSLSAAGS